MMTPTLSLTAAGDGDLVHGGLQRGGAGEHDEVSPGQRGPELLLDGLQLGEGGVQAGVHRPVPPRGVSAGGEIDIIVCYSISNIYAIMSHDIRRFGRPCHHYFGIELPILMILTLNSWTHHYDSCPPPPPT